MGYVKLENWNGSIGDVQLNIFREKDSLLAFAFEFDKDTTGLEYKFTVIDSRWNNIFEKNLDPVNIVTWERQLSITKNNSIDEWSTLSIGSYLYGVKECVVATWWDWSVLTKGNFTVLDEYGNC